MDKPVAVMTSTVKEGSTSVTFNIPRNATIKSDKKPHKVKKYIPF